MEDTKNGQMGLAIMAGLAVGAAVWYFMNTKNGKQHWETLVDFTKELTDKLKNESLNSSKNISNHIASNASAFKDSIQN
jgi:uncharacterized protein HemX